jgi:hypothetical protein
MFSVIISAILSAAALHIDFHKLSRASCGFWLKAAIVSQMEKYNLHVLFIEN